MTAIALPLHGRRAAKQQLAVLVDIADLPRVAQHRWYLNKKGYAVANLPGKKQITLHRFILKAKPGEQCDHKNGIPLDCRRKNLRFATREQNARNQKKRAGCTSRYRGVSYSKSKRRWVAHIYIDRRLRYLGSFRNEIEAARNYDRAARQHFGEFARINFPGAAA